VAEIGETFVFVIHQIVQFQTRVLPCCKRAMCWKLGLCDGDPAPYENDTFLSLRGCVR
jgi:hypothetical protein